MMRFSIQPTDRIFKAIDFCLLSKTWLKILVKI